MQIEALSAWTCLKTREIPMTADEKLCLDYEEQTGIFNSIRKQHADAIHAAEEELRKRAALADFKWVVLDDDPTGVQTVHDLPVYTDWSEETFMKALQEPCKVFYVLTNSRGLTRQNTTVLHRTLCDHLASAAKRLHTDYQIISRSDSTLRGHFPLEMDLLNDKMQELYGMAADGIIMAPFFQAGGRFTINDIHYVRQNGELVPAAQTEFAKDATFGYSHSDLSCYIEEKTEGRVKADDVLSIPLALLCRGDVEGVTDILDKAETGVPVIVNALDPSDLYVFAAALYRVLAEGKHFLYRVAADFVRAVGAIPDRPLLTRDEMVTAWKADRTQESHSGTAPRDTHGESHRGGIICVGSHTEKTTRQLDMLRGMEGLDFIEFNSDLVLEHRLEEEAKRVRRLVDRDIAKGITPVFYTKRKELIIEDDTKEQALERSVAISEALVSVIREMKEKPSYVIAKGGITSSDVATRAMRVKRAWVLGQVQPGIPVWKCGSESKFPGVPYIIFPGNVGNDDTLYRVVMILQGNGSIRD